MTERQIAAKTFGRYIILHTIGKGEFGKVKLAYDPQKELEVAIKFIKRSNITSAQKQAKLEREINILQNLNHPHIVRLYDVIETEKYIGIVMAYANGGELFEYISENQYLSEEESAKFFIQLLDGVQYLHSRHIVHRDLKLENLLLDQKGDIVITDFGFANNSLKNPSGLLSTSCGSPCYAAPELVINDNYVGEAADIWSCGIILYAMLCGYLPFDDDPNNPDGENLDLLYKYILESQLTFPEYVSEEAQELVCGMLIPDPEKRWPMEKVMNHRWLRNSIYYKEKMNEAMQSMNIDYIYDDSYLKYINESSVSEIEKMQQQEAKVPDYPQSVPHGAHSRQIGLDDETEHTAIYDIRNNVSVSDNVDNSIDRTEYIPSQEIRPIVPIAIPTIRSAPEISKPQSISQTSSSQEYMDAQQELPEQKVQPMEVDVEEVVPTYEDKMDIDEESPAQVSPNITSEEDKANLEVERKNAEKQIEKLINEIQQEEFTQLEEMKDQLQEVVKDDETVEEPKTEVSIEPKKEEVAIPQENVASESPVEPKEEVVPEVTEVPQEIVTSEVPVESKEGEVVPEVTEVPQEIEAPKAPEASVAPVEPKEEEPEVVEEVKEEVKPVVEKIEDKEEVAVPEPVVEKTEEVKEEVTIPEPSVEEVKEETEAKIEEKVDSPSTIKLDKEDLIDVDEINPHSTSTSTETEEEKEVKKEEEEEKVDNKAETTLNDIEMKEQSISKESEVTTMEEDEVEILKKTKKEKTKKDKGKIKKRGKDIKKNGKSKNKKNIKVKIRENKMFRTFFGCIMRD